MARVGPITLTPPRVPAAVDPLRRCRVGRDLDAVTSLAPEVEPASAGMTRDGVERIWNAARALYRTGIHPAIALCVRREGRVVLDRAIGHARGNGPHDTRDTPKVPVHPSTPFCIFSASKAITATVVHLLDERGLLHIEDRVCEYIPEYAKHGKDVMTIEHVLSHRAGVPTLPAAALDLANLDDHEFLVQMMCAAKPRTRPGKLLSYHAISGGFILAEIVQRVTGKDLRSVLREEILDPLGFDLGAYGIADERAGEVALSYPTGAPVLPPLSNVLTRAFGVPFDRVTELSNDPRFLRGTIPAANVVTTANELSRFFELLRAGGELDGVRVLEPRTIRRAISERAYRELDFTLIAPLRHSSGFMLGAQALSLYGPDTELAFGHLGFTNVLGWADPERAISVGLLTSGKPALHHGLPDLWNLTRHIGLAAPKVAHPALSF